MTTPPGGGDRDAAPPDPPVPSWGPPSWPPPGGPPADPTRIGPPPAGDPWAAPGAAPQGWGPQAGPPGWGPPGGAPPARGTTDPAQQGWGAGQGGQPGWGRTSAQPGWGPAQPGGPWGPQPGGPWPPGAGGGWGPQQAWGAPPPQRGRGRAIALVLVGAVVLAGLGVGAFLLVRATTAGSTGGGPVVPADFREVTAAGLTWSVPPDWTAAPDGTGGAVAGAELEGVHDAAPYECGGSGYLRGLTGAALVGAGVPPAEAAEEVAREAGAAFYQPAGGAAPDVRLSAPRPVDAGGAPAQLVEATVRAADDGCLATGGLLLVLAVPVAEGTAVLVVNGDTEGGPPSAPPVPDRAVLDAIVASARPAGGI